MASKSDVTVGDLSRQHSTASASDFFQLVFVELRAMAERAMRGERAGHTLQPTALINELYLRLEGSSTVPATRAHFLATAARAMRAILVDHARHRIAARRGGDRKRVPLDVIVAQFESSAVELGSLNEALATLDCESPLSAKIVELRFFGGMTNSAAAEALDVPLRTVEREWRYARARLKVMLAPSAHAQSDEA